MEERDQRSYRRQLVRAATHGRAQAEKATAASLAQIGIAVETVNEPDAKEGG